MLKVVFAYDESLQAKKAIDCLSWWPANSLNVILLTALRGGPALNEAGKAVDCDPQEKARAEEILNRLKEDLAMRGIVAVSQVVAGDPRDVIIDVANQVSADLILMGTHGRSRVGKLLLGSVAASILAECDIPVVLCR